MTATVASWLHGACDRCGRPRAGADDPDPVEAGPWPWCYRARGGKFAAECEVRHAEHSPSERCGACGRVRRTDANSAADPFATAARYCFREWRPHGAVYREECERIAKERKALANTATDGTALANEAIVRAGARAAERAPAEAPAADDETVRAALRAIGTVGREAAIAMALNGGKAAGDAIPCARCGKPCEIERHAYAVPTCFACLPPPPPLPTADPARPRNVFPPCARCKRPMLSAADIAAGYGPAMGFCAADARPDDRAARDRCFKAAINGAIEAADAGAKTAAAPGKPDAINHPPHYTSHPSGIECITIVEHFGFNIGNAIKYAWRAGLKGDALEDLKKGRWYLDREIARLGGGEEK